MTKLKYYRFKTCLPTAFVATTENTTTEIELTGISIAAIIGESTPCTAKNSPMIL